VKPIFRTFLALALAVCPLGAADLDSSVPPTSTAPTAHPVDIDTFTAGMDVHDGYFPFYWDARKGKIFLTIDAFDTEFLYVNSLPAGVGSNDIGLDRGKLGTDRVVKFVRTGPKVLLMQTNTAFRAVSSDPLEQQSAEQAFAQSALGGFTVVAESENRALIDFTPFILQDTYGVADRLEATKQGTYSVDQARSMLFLERTKNFPANTEFEAVLTFAGKKPGEWVRSVVPTPEVITVRLHHSLVKLPDADYQPRRHDPRSGYGFTSYLDFATPINEPIMQRVINRHRLEKVDPTTAISEAKQPIIYYLDPGTPEPIRSALIEGASWWDQAFAAAGFRNAFQVKMLPPDADPMDVRYNLIQWVHRSTRGWSYGASVVDPRTGEIIKGQVSLGSLRARQDLLIAEGLLQPYADDTPVSEDLLHMVLARIRQLSAHEVGHTLGLLHNFASSTNERSSVMDYPHPWLTLDESGNVDLRNAYATGIGAWDRHAINYGYREFPAESDEAQALDSILRETSAAGLLYITDQDARPMGGAHPVAHLWDNGADPADELTRIMAIRQKILAQFSADALRPGAPMATLEEVLVPMYLIHRYQVDATAKLIGGLDFSYTLKGDGQPTQRWIAPARQLKALDALLSTLSPAALSLPETLLAQIATRPPGFPLTKETFERRTSPEFDAFAAAESAADLTLDYLLHPARATRLVQHHARDARQPGLSTVLARLLDATWYQPPVDGYAGGLRRVVDKVVLYGLMQLANDPTASDQARAVTFLQLQQLETWLAEQARSPTNPAQKAHVTFARHQIARWLDNPADFPLQPRTALPDGAPIGMSDLMACGH
jgi:hypothetical protein